MNQDEEPEVTVYVPTLVALLLRAEELKGDPLTEAEVLRIKDASESMTVPLSVKQASEQSRGYADIDPDRAWEEWQAVRSSLRED